MMTEVYVVCMYRMCDLNSNRYCKHKRRQASVHMNVCALSGEESRCTRVPCVANLHVVAVGSAACAQSAHPIHTRQYREKIHHGATLPPMRLFLARNGQKTCAAYNTHSRRV